MTELNLDDIRLMPVEDMGDAEKAFLKEHEAELDDDEKAAFQEFLKVEDAPAEGEEGEEGSAAASGEGSEEKIPEFKTQAELDEYVENKVKEREAAAAAKAKEEADAADAAGKKDDAPLKFFEEGWEPKDWNDFAVNFAKALVERPELARSMAPIIRAEMESMTAAERKEMDKINEGFDAELETLHKEGLIPDPKTPEGIKVDKQISMIGARMGLPTMREAYDQWSKTPKEFGGGYDPAARRVITQKQKAGLVSKGGGSGAVVKKEITHDDLHKKSMDELIDSV